MSLASSFAFTPYAIKTSVVKITSYKDKILKGTISNSFYDRELRFENLMQFILLMEKLQDDIKYPQKSMEPRKFVSKDAPQQHAFADTDEGAPAIATFRIDILFRQNASWQGSAVWLEHETESSFRSAMELFMLIDNVLA